VAYAAPRQSLRSRAFAAFEVLDVWVILAVALALSVAFVPFFATKFNISNLLTQCTILGVLSIAQYLVVVVGEFDLSVGAVMAAASVVFASVATESLYLGIAAALLTGLVFGVLNGIVTTYGRVPSLIVTLATLGIARGLAFAVTETAIPNRTQELMDFARALVGWVPASTILWLTLAAAVTLFLYYSGLGSHLLAIGGNESVARTSGIRVTAVKIGVFTTAGLLVGIAGVLFVVRTRSGIPQGGSGMELASIAAIVIGGTRLFGGEGSLPKAMAGVVIFVMIRNALGLLGVDPFVTDFVIAAVIIAAVGARTIGQPREI
jgi:ribose/xylose/arabinose/galactoside ABC-type transport system permease subunit